MEKHDRRSPVAVDFVAYPDLVTVCERLFGLTRLPGDVHGAAAKEQDRTDDGDSFEHLTS